MAIAFQRRSSRPCQVLRSTREEARVCTAFGVEPHLCAARFVVSRFRQGGTNDDHERSPPPGGVSINISMRKCHFQIFKPDQLPSREELEEVVKSDEYLAKKPEAMGASRRDGCDHVQGAV